DRARQSEPGLFVEAARAALPLEARGLDADDARAALLELGLDAGEQRRADAAPARVLRDDQPVKIEGRLGHRRRAEAGVAQHALGGAVAVGHRDARFVALVVGLFLLFAVVGGVSRGQRRVEQLDRARDLGGA